MPTSRRAIANLEEIQSLFQLVKSHRRGLITNFFLEPFKHGIWADRGEIELHSIRDTAFLVHANIGFKKLFYISPSAFELEGAVAEFIGTGKGEKYVVDVVGNGNAVSGEVSAFGKMGFTHRAILLRLSGEAPSSECMADDSIGYAEIRELPLINALFQQHFDKYVEQLPMQEELRNWAERKQLLIFRAEQELGGFLIFDSTPHTAYLRYWFVRPDCRDRSIGSQLMRRFFAKNRGVQRVAFWVIQTNENAIMRYAHYGFTPEQLRDFVLTYNIAE